MNRLIKFTKLFAIIAIIGLLSSCSKDANQLNIVPSETSMLIVLDAKELNSKSGIDDISETNFYSMLKEELDNEELAQFDEYFGLFKEADKNGVDINSKIIIFTDLTKMNSAGISLKLTDSEKLKALLEKKLKDEGVDYAFVSKKNVEFLKIPSNENMILAWNDNTFLAYSYVNSSNSYDSNEEYISELFNLKKENSLAGNKDVQNFMKDSKDISIWMDYRKMFESMPPSQAMMIYSQIPFDLDDVYVHSHINFEKSKAVMSYTVVPNKEMEAIIKKYDILNQSFNKDILNYIPDNDIINISFAMNPENLYSMMMEVFGEKQEKLIDVFKSQFKNQTQMEFDDFVNGLGGSVYAGIYDFNYVEVEVTDWNAYMKSTAKNKSLDDFKITQKQPIPVFAVATDLQDDKVFNALNKMASEFYTKNEDYYMIEVDRDMTIYFAYNEDIMLFSNDELLIKDFSKSEKHNKPLAKSDIGKSISKNSVFLNLNVNIDSYPTNIKEMIRLNMSGSTLLEKITSDYKNIEMYNDGNYTQYIIFHTKDNSKNSLEVIIKSFDKNIEEISEI